MRQGLNNEYALKIPYHLDALSGHLAGRQVICLERGPSRGRKELIRFPAISELRPPLQPLQMPVDAIPCFTLRNLSSVLDEKLLQQRRQSRTRAPIHAIFSRQNSCSCYTGC